MSVSPGRAQLVDLSRTALRTLAARAAESAHPDGLFADSAAEAAAAALAPELASVRTSRFPTTADVIRTRIIDDWVEEVLAGDRRVDVLNLGAGLCTRYFRIGPIPGTWYEIDLPGIMAVRRRLFPAAPNHVELACSVLEPGWIDRIPRAHAVLLIAEGLLFYLAEAAVRELLHGLASACAGATMIFDVLGPAHVGRQREIETLQGLDAPFRWGLADTRSVESWDPRIEWRRDESIFDRCPERWGESLPGLQSLRRSHGNLVVQVDFRSDHACCC
jgi:methyltransferase (TIGR00027 family)